MPHSKSPQWLLHLYTQSPIAIAIYIGYQHVIEFANPKMRLIWARTAEEVLNKPLFEALPEVSKQGFEEILAEVLATGVPFMGDNMPATLQRNGKLDLAYFNILYEPLRDENNRIYGVTQTAVEVTELVKSRQRAERNEEILKIALGAGKMGTWHMNLVNMDLERSLEHDKIFGYQQGVENWSIERYLRHVVPEDRAFAEKKFRDAVQQGTLNYEARIQWPDESIHWIQVKGETVYNLKEKPISMSGIIMDITEQKLAEKRERQRLAEQSAREEAQRQEQTLNHLFMEAPALICTLKGPSHVFDMVNPLYQQLFAGRELKGKSVLNALPELAGQPFKELLDRVYQSEESYVGNEVPLSIQQPDTDEFVTKYFNFVYQPMHNTKGEVHGVLVFAYDITEQIVAKKTIELHEENLRLALEAGNMGTWNLDVVNETSVRSIQHDQIFGYQQPLPAWQVADYLAHVVPADRSLLAAAFDQLETWGTLQCEVRIRRADDQERWILLKGKAFYENDKLLRMAGVVMDITERKLVEINLQSVTEELAASNEELAAANEEIQASVEELSDANQQLVKINADLDNFIYTASHDLRAPISNIEGLIHMLTRNLSADKLQKNVAEKLIGLIQISVERFKKTIGELTNIAQLQKEIQEKDWVSLLDIVQEVQNDLQPAIEEANAILDVKASVCPPIEFSYKNLKSMVYNLLSNAIKYRDPERQLNIKLLCYQEGGYQVFIVQDNGLGISESGKSKIFLMFKRLHTHVEGSGVGLYLVKRIVDNAEGRLEVVSEEGKGSTFKIYLPLETP